MANLSWISSNPDYINQMIRNTQVTLSNNYNDLDNIPIIKITSTTNNPQKIWELKEGLYMVNGVIQVDNSTSYEVSNLLISMTARLENGKYILSAFVPYLRGLFEYILKTNSTEYEQHQKIVLMIKDDTLTLDNETIYTPIEDYHPATKKYVDDKANEIVAELDRMGVNKENLESLNKENRIRDIKLQALLSETSDRNITIEENVRYFDMPLSIDNGIVTINEIVGETLVNVCDQEESVAITKSYTVENENHIALQGEYDGSCRPIVYGNTLVNHNADWDDSLQTGIVTSASGVKDVEVEGIKGQEVSVVVEGNTVLNHALGKTSAVVSSIESENEGNYVDLTVANDMSSVVEIEGRTMVNLMPNLPFRQNQTSQGQYWVYKYFTLNQPTKANTVYTLIFDIIENTAEVTTFHLGGKNDSFELITVPISGVGRYIITAMSNNETYDHSQFFVQFQDIYEIGAFEVRIMIFEGDLTQTPHLIPSGYVEGLKSSYECEVTEDGKYKVDVKVTGKNKFNGELEIGSITSNGVPIDDTRCVRVVDYINIKPNTAYIISNDKSYIQNIYFYDIDYNCIKTINTKNSFTTPQNCMYIKFRSNITDVQNDLSVKYQLEEGTEATSYEPYFESTKTFYLNSPLLEGDKIVTKNGKVHHYHKMGKVVLDGSENSWLLDGSNDEYSGYFFNNSAGILNFNIENSQYCISDKFSTISSHPHWKGLDMEGCIDNTGNIAFVIKNTKLSTVNVTGFRQWLQANPTTVVYELASPYYELIDEYNNTILNIPNTVAHLTHTSAVPVNNTTFTNYIDELNVLEANTQYRVMFDCDKANVPFTITLGGTSQTVTSKIGTHSLLITTPSTLVDKNLVIDGIGRCGIDNIRIFKGDVEYDYVKGLWSGYEERKLENLWNTFVYVNNTNFDTRTYGFRPSDNGFLEIKTDGVNWLTPGSRTPLLMKPKTLYTVIFEIKDSTYPEILENNVKSRVDINIDYNNNTRNRQESVFSGTCNIPIKNGITVHKLTTRNNLEGAIYSLRTQFQPAYTGVGSCKFRVILLEGDWTDNPPTYEEVIANEGKYAVKVKLDTNANIFGKGGRL